MAEQLGLPHAGVVSFGHRPFLTEVEQLESWRPDVAIVGAPFDISTTNRPGARFGPRAIRATAYEPGTYHMDLGLEIFDWLEVVDFGDAYCPHGQTEVSHTNIRERVHAIASRGIVPVILGGDHSITWPAATAVADVHGYGNVGIVHFDAHADTADEIEGNLASHGTPMRRLIESGAVPGACAGSSTSMSTDTYNLSALASASLTASRITSLKPRSQISCMVCHVMPCSSIHSKVSCGGQ